MNKTTKILSLAVATFAIVGMIGVFNSQAFANPPGAPDGKLQFKFNIIAAPVGWSGNLPDNNGHKIITERGANNQHILWTLCLADVGQKSKDCGPGHNNFNTHIEDHATEAIDGTEAEIHIDEANKYEVWVRIHGKNGGTLSICSAIKTDHDDPLKHDECLLGFVNLEKKGAVSNFKFPNKLFHDINEDILWHLNSNNDFRIAEVRLYS